MKGNLSIDSADLEVTMDDFDIARAVAIYREHGCLVVRGLMRPYIDSVVADIEWTVQESRALLDQAERVPEGWKTPNGALFLPAPEHFERDKQIMTVPISYRSSAAFFRSALDARVIAIVTSILGPDVELQKNGQCLYKEPVGGHPKHLHQDSAYFEHKFEGPVGVLTYGVSTDLVNGALHVVPGSHRLGQLRHIDTFSHLGLDGLEWPWERALPICGQAGDSIFFNVRTIHGSKENNSPRPRPVFIHRYRRVDDYVVVGGTTVANRADAEKRAEAMRRELKSDPGLMVSGLRRYAPESGNG